MGRKSKIPYEIKLAAAEAYERNEGSLKTVAEQFGLKKHNPRSWWDIYQSHGKEGLMSSNIKTTICVLDHLGTYTKWFFLPSSIKMIPKNVRPQMAPNFGPSN